MPGHRQLCAEVNKSILNEVSLQMNLGFSRLVDAAVCFFCCVILATTLLPQLLRHRSQARAEDCRDHLKQIGLAMHHYHAAYNQLPPGCGGTIGGETEVDSNRGRLGPLVCILPWAPSPGTMPRSM